MNTVKQKARRLGARKFTLERYSQCAYSLFRMKKKKIVIITGSPSSIYVFFSVVSSILRQRATVRQVHTLTQDIGSTAATKQKPTDANRTHIGGSWLTNYLAFHLPDISVTAHLCVLYVLMSWLSRPGRVVPVFSLQHLAVHQMFHHRSGERETYGARIFISS